MGKTGGYTVKHHFMDIIEKAGTPDWFDSNGTPRYGPFKGCQSAPDIYADYVALARIRCQACGKLFIVEMDCERFGVYRKYQRDIVEEDLPDFPNGRIGLWHYGDPPIHGCIGDTMNSEPCSILEFWGRKKEESEDRRMLEYEGVWAYPGEWDKPIDK
jgi:hypothetical protein